MKSVVVCVCVCVQVCLFVFDCVKVSMCTVGVVHLHVSVLMYLTHSQHVLAWDAMHYTFGPITMHTCVCISVCVCALMSMCLESADQTPHRTSPACPLLGQRLPLYGVPQQKAGTWWQNTN